MKKVKIFNKKKFNFITITQTINVSIIKGIFYKFDFKTIDF